MSGFDATAKIREGRYADDLTLYVAEAGCAIRIATGPKRGAKACLVLDVGYSQLRVSLLVGATAPDVVLTGVEVVDRGDVEQHRVEDAAGEEADGKPRIRGQDRRVLNADADIAPAEPGGERL